MTPEEQKLFDEFKIAIKATQHVEFDNYVKPFLIEQNAMLKKEISHLRIAVISMFILVIISILYFMFIK